VRLLGGGLLGGVLARLGRRLAQLDPRRRRTAVGRLPVQPSMRQALRRSAATASSRASSSAEPVARSASTGVFIDVLARLFSPRTRSSTAAATSSASCGRSPRGRRLRAAGLAQRTRRGQGCACTEPSRHQDHTSSVAKGSTGANSRSSTSSDIAQRAVRRGGGLDVAPYARPLTSSM
jgi:hypothetical protein